MEKILSISVAAYNLEPWIDICLKSFCQCQYLEFLEIIIVDDGSTDRTAQLAKEYVKRYPNSFKLIQKKDEGYGSTINAALKIAQGKYFKTIDGDDWVDPIAMDDLVVQLKNTKADVVINNYRQIFPNGDRLIDLHGKQKYGKVYFFRQLKGHYGYAMHGLTIRLSTYKKYALPISENRCWVDTEYVFWAIVATQTIMFLEPCVYQYRLGRPGQASIDGVYAHLEDSIRLNKNLIRMLKYAKQFPLDEEKKTYLTWFIKMQYRFAIACFAAVEQRDKDQLLRKFILDMKEKYSEYISMNSLGVYIIVYLPWPIGIYILRKLKKMKIHLTGRNF